MSDREGASPTDTDGQGDERPTERRALALGAALRQAWVGYQRRLDQEMAAAGFSDRGFPDGRVLRLCARGGEVTASQIGRDLGMTRQGAGKIVAVLSDRGYVTIGESPSDRREKVLSLTTRAHDYLAAQRSASRRIESDIRAQVGAEAFEALTALLDALGGEDQPRMRDYLGRKLRFSDS